MPPEVRRAGRRSRCRAARRRPRRPALGRRISARALLAGAAARAGPRSLAGAASILALPARAALLTATSAPAAARFTLARALLARILLARGLFARALLDDALLGGALFLCAPLARCGGGAGAPGAQGTPPAPASVSGAEPASGSPDAAEDSPASSPPSEDPPERARIASIELRLAKSAEAVEADLVGDRVQIGERAGVKLGALEYGHGVLSFVDEWVVGARSRCPATGTRGCL